MDHDEIREALQAMRARDLPTHGGRTLAYVYDSGLASADAIGREALAAFASTNGLDPTAFPSLLRMENDLVGIAGRLIDAPDGFAGVVTSGGTESILLAVLAARDARPDITAPRMVLPTTAHAAFHKAAHWRGADPGQLPWTFAVDGVTSVSLDLHKYAYTPKGVSVLLHASAELRRTHLFASARWPGYTMLNTTAQSTKSGGPIAAAWAVVHHIGADRYASLATDARTATLDLASAVDGIPGLTVAAPPDSTLLALVADDSCDVFTISDEMLDRGWFVQPQMRFRDLPATLHLTFSAATAASSDLIAADLADATAAARTTGPARPPVELVAMASAIDPATLDEATFTGLLTAAGLAGGDGTLVLPERMAPVNALLDALPPELREALLLGVIDRLARPTP